MTKITESEIEKFAIELLVHGHVTRAADWPNSSIHRYIAAGMIDRDWGGGDGGSEESSYGER